MSWLLAGAALDLSEFTEPGDGDTVALAGPPAAHQPQWMIPMQRARWPSGVHTRIVEVLLYLVNNPLLVLLRRIGTSGCTERDWPDNLGVAAPASCLYVQTQ
jgi:hypothetical protein